MRSGRIGQPRPNVADVDLAPRINYSVAGVASVPGCFFASTRRVPDFRSLITKVLFSPSFDHGPRGTSLNSTNCQSVTSVSFKPRKSRTAGETSRPAPLFKFGFGRSFPNTYCQ